MNELLALLLGQQQAVVDPRGPAILQNLNEGNVPEQNRLSDFNTALDFLSPSAAVDFQERTSPDLGAVGQKLGLTPEELDLIIRQSTGLQLSPLQAQQGNIALAQAAPAFMTAQARQAEVPIKQQEANIKGREATTRETEAAAKTSEAATKKATEARLKELQALDPVRKNAAFDLSVKDMLLKTKPDGTSVDLLGRPVDAQTVQNARTIFQKGQTDPAALELFKGLIGIGEFEIAAKLMQLPEGSLGDFWFEIGKHIEPGTTLPGLQPFSGGGGAAGPSALTAPGGGVPLTLEEKIRQAEELIGGIPDDTQLP